MSGHRWTRAEARIASRKGLLARLKVAPERQPEYRKGYHAGWKACERFWIMRRDDEAQRQAS